MTEKNPNLPDDENRIDIVPFKKAGLSEGDIDELPDDVIEGIKTPAGAMGVFMAVMLDGYVEVRENQLEYIEEKMGVEIYDDANVIAEQLDEGCRYELKMPIARLTLPGLRRLAKEDYLLLRRSASEILHMAEEAEFHEPESTERDILTLLTGELDPLYGVSGE
ncbi:MAG: hypothetical protein IJJ20_02015 [Thermoguttaceae bacterium]|nr:hypothetical protein [Thermoguttaceae bacterium]